MRDGNRVGPAALGVGLFDGHHHADNFRLPIGEGGTTRSFHRPQIALQQRRHEQARQRAVRRADDAQRNDGPVNAPGRASHHVFTDRRLFGGQRERRQFLPFTAEQRQARIFIDGQQPRVALRAARERQANAIVGRGKRGGNDRLGSHAEAGANRDRGFRRLFLRSQIGWIVTGNLRRFQHRLRAANADGDNRFLQPFGSLLPIPGRRFLRAGDQRLGRNQQGGDG